MEPKIKTTSASTHLFVQNFNCFITKTSQIKPLQRNHRYCTVFWHYLEQSGDHSETVLQLK